MKEREKLRKKELENNLKDTEEGISALREKWRKKKHNQRQNQRQNQSKQKKFAVRQKEKARKGKEKLYEQEIQQTSSTERVKKHRGSLKVTCKFIRKKTLSTLLRKSRKK